MVEAGATLDLQNIELNGYGLCTVIENRGDLYMGEEALITGGASQANGGAVRNLGSFYMSGGEISGNTAVLGGGVYNATDNNGTAFFDMGSSAITGNIDQRRPP